jgi:hypothetical protein
MAQKLYELNCLKFSHIFSAGLSLTWAETAQSVWPLRYGLEGPGIESRWGGGGGEIFHSLPDRRWGPPSLLYNGYRVFPGGKAAEVWR